MVISDIFSHPRSYRSGAGHTGALRQGIFHFNIKPKIKNYTQPFLVIFWDLVLPRYPKLNYSCYTLPPVRVEFPRRADSHEPRLSLCSSLCEYSFSTKRAHGKHLWCQLLCPRDSWSTQTNRPDGRKRRPWIELNVRPLLNRGRWHGLIRLNLCYLKWKVIKNGHFTSWRVSSSTKFDQVFVFLHLFLSIKTTH